MRGRPKAALVLSDSEREQLVALTRRRTTAQALALRARIVSGAVPRAWTTRSWLRSSGSLVQTVSQVASAVSSRIGWTGCSMSRVPGAPRTHRRRARRCRDRQDAGVACLRVRRTGVRARWPRDGPVADGNHVASGAPSACSRTGRKRFKLSTDPLFVEKVRDIVGLYLNPPRRPSCCALTRSARSRRSIARSRSCRWPRACPSGAPTTTCGTGRPRSSRPWTSPPAR